MCKLGFIITATVLLSACSPAEEASVEGRWFSKAQVEQGKEIFTKNCAACHGLQAEGTADWKRRDLKGNLPPPPLNGTAHAWHHSNDVLMRTIADGGEPLGGTMPAFRERLAVAEMRAAIAFIQSHWSDTVYSMWRQRNTSR